MLLRPYRIDLYAANGKTIKTFGMTERVGFKFGGYELETNFVVGDDAMLLSISCLAGITCEPDKIFNDLTAMKVVVRAPLKPVWHHTYSQVCNPDLGIPVTLDQNIVLPLFERTVMRATVGTHNLEPISFQNVMFNASIADASLRNVVVTVGKRLTLRQPD